MKRKLLLLAGIVATMLWSTGTTLAADHHGGWSHHSGHSWNGSWGFRHESRPFFGFSLGYPYYYNYPYPYYDYGYPYYYQPYPYYYGPYYHHRHFWFGW